MSDEFDPYYRWLGIPAEEQPPHHYRLLGVKTFEADTDVISNAADRQMNYVRTFQMGGRGNFAEEILNKIAVAKVCLLSATQKAEYDRRLKTQLGDAPQTAANTSLAQETVAQATASPDLPPPEAPPQAPPPRILVSTTKEVRQPGSSRVGRQKSGKRSWLKTSTQAAVALVVVLLLINGGIIIYQKYFQGGEATPGTNGDGANNSSKSIPETPPGEMPPGENVLAGLDLEAAAVVGNWTRAADGAVLSDRTRYAMLHVPVEVSGSYMLALTLQRVEGGEQFAITLPVGSSRCSIVLDGGRAGNARGSGIELLRGNQFMDNSTRHAGRVLETGKDVIVRCYVTPDSVRVECNGKQIISWTGNAADLSVPNYWDASQKDGIQLGSNRTSFRVESVVIVPAMQ